MVEITVMHWQRAREMPAMTPEDRLKQVWAALINPKRAIRSIQILAKEHGFDDLAEFKSRVSTTLWR